MSMNGRRVLHLACAVAAISAPTRIAGAQRAPERIAPERIAQLRAESHALETSARPRATKDSTRRPVQIAGRVTLGSGVLDSARLIVYVDDGSGGIRVFGDRGGHAPRAREGDSVTVAGLLDTYHGMPEISHAAL